jgi:hypothetical protein
MIRNKAGDRYNRKSLALFLTFAVCLYALKGINRIL